MKLVKCDLNNCNVNVANSIRKKFELETFHKTNKLIDDYLKEVITSVHPATTTASTTSMQTWLFPAEHNWLGWDTYIPELKRSVTLYKNAYKDTDILCDIPVGKTYMPYKTIVEEINEKGKYKAVELFPFGKKNYTNLDDMFKKIIKYSRDKTKKYIYAYYTEPDCLLHEFGNNTKEVIDCIKMLNDKSKEYIEKLENSLVIITSDHGHTDIEYYYLEDYPDVQDLLENENKRLKSTLGDFFFLAKSNKGIKDKKGDEVMKSSHAGITDR